MHCHYWMDDTYFAKKLAADAKGEKDIDKEGVIIGIDGTKLSAQFIKAIAQHRFWEREKTGKVPG